MCIFKIHPFAMETEEVKNATKFSLKDNSDDKLHLLVNSSNDSHLLRIDNLISDADEICIAVAFLKHSGLTELLPNIEKAVQNKRSVKIIAGQHFGLTEPAALWQLFRLFQEYPAGNLYLAFATSNEIFHPKLYLFRKGTECKIIIGSANITMGGMVNNWECSILTGCKTIDSVWVDARDYFDELCAYQAVKASRLEILRYEKYFKEQKPINKALKSYPIRKVAGVEFNYDSLRKHFKKYDNKEREERYKRRLSEYRSAKRILDRIASDNQLNKRRFKEMLDELVGGSPDHYAYWHSGGLSRGKTGKEESTGVYDHWKEFQKLIKFVRLNIGEDEDFVFEHGREILKSIRGAGINYLTEILMTYDRKRFANMNKNPLTVLTKEAGVDIKKSTQSYSGADYKEYCELIKEISEELGLQDMLEADSFFNDVYWPLKKKLKR